MQSDNGPFYEGQRPNSRLEMDSFSASLNISSKKVWKEGLAGKSYSKFIHIHTLKSANLPDVQQFCLSFYRPELEVEVWSGVDPHPRVHCYWLRKQDTSEWARTRTDRLTPTHSYFGEASQIFNGFWTHNICRSISCYTRLRHLKERNIEHFGFREYVPTKLLNALFSHVI